MQDDLIMGAGPDGNEELGEQHAQGAGGPRLTHKEAVTLRPGVLTIRASGFQGSCPGCGGDLGLFEHTVGKQVLSILAAGRELVMQCPKCKAVFPVRKSMIVQANTGPNRAQRREHAVLMKG